MTQRLGAQHLLVLQLLKAGYSLDQIAVLVGTPRGELRVRVEEAMRALGARDESAAIAEATRRGLLT
jgi:DNA-binding NarL/FixJ family response regulator